MGEMVIPQLVRTRSGNNFTMSKTELMKQIKGEVFALTNSPLYQYRTEHKFFPVIGEGSHDAEIMFVGEAPGLNEAKTGRPFCGRAGLILDELFASIGMDRKSVYVTNIVKDRPPQNRDPLPEEIKVYGPYLNRQIDIIKPKVVVALGRFSMQYIFQKFGLTDVLEPISKMHGRVFEATAPYGKISLVVLYHPAVAVYNPHSKDELKKDFAILKQFAVRNG